MAKVKEIILETFQTYSKKLPIFRTPLDQFDEFYLIIQVIAISNYDQHMVKTTCRAVILLNP